MLALICSFPRLVARGRAGTFPGQLGRPQDRLDDAVVTGATAEVPGHRLDRLLAGRIRVVRQERGDGGEEPGGTEAALQPVTLPESLLYGTQLIILGTEALHRGDRVPLGADGKHETRSHRLPVDEHRAGSTDTVLAANMGAGEAHLVT